MKYSYKWLQELSGTDKSPEELAAFLTMRAFEVEELESAGFSNDRVVIGEVVSLEKHPDADKLRVAQVNVGAETLTIVCGAPNVEAGQKVAVALVGATLPGEFEIAKRSVRGVESNGMICSQKELGLGEDHDGIWVLPVTAKVGMSLEDFLGGADTLLDIKVLPDRAHDCLSHVGMAREIAALEGRELDFDFDGLTLPFETLPEGFSVAIDDDRCASRYIGAMVQGVDIGDSPAWLQSRLRILGVRPINVVVDITNYVMLEVGQPLHAFDGDLIAGSREKSVVVRRAHEGETLELLDEKEYALTSEDIVIADAEKPLALAGIMGGESSAVTAATKTVFFEAASFDPVMIRRTRERLGIRTDASDRFEKGLGSVLAEKALARALEILQHVATPGEVRVTQVLAHPPVSKEIMCSLREIEALLGVAVDEERAKQALRLLGFEVGGGTQDGEWNILVPSWRLDIDGAADIAEEIGKMIGYETIPSQAPLVRLQAPEMSRDRSLKRTILDTLVARGCTEVYNYSFLSERDFQLARLDREVALPLANPMNPDQAFLRTSLVPGLVRTVRENLKHFDSCAIVENGRVYVRSSEGVVDESERFGGAVTARDSAEAFFVLKGELDALAESLGVVLVWTPTRDDAGTSWHPTQSAEVSVAGEHGASRVLGRVGAVHPSVQRAFGVRSGVACFEWNTSVLMEVIPSAKRYEALQRFPGVLRDSAFYVPRGVFAADIVAALRRLGGELLVDATVFDQYLDTETGRKSLAFHLMFASPDRTLESEEVDTLWESVMRGVESELGLEARR